MENLKNVLIVLVTSEEKLEKLAAQPCFKQFQTFNKNLVAMERAKVELMLNRLICVGFTTLHLLKILMYDFHHSYNQAEVSRIDTAICQYRFPHISSSNG